MHYADDIPPKIKFAIFECKEMFKKTDSVHIPKVYEQYTNPRVMVMSYEDGIPLNRVK